MVLYFLGATVLCVAVGVALLVYVKIKSYGKSMALFASLMAAILVTLVFPIPIHGGFTFLFEIMAHEMRSQPNQRQAEQKPDNKLIFREKLAERFKAELEFTIVSQESPEWYRVTTGSGPISWFDSQSQLVWSGPISLPDAQPNLSLPVAKEYCRNLTPAGYWALPNEAELYFFWKNGGSRFSPGQGCRSVSFIADIETQIEIPTVFLGFKECTAIRCVARAERAPQTGYTREDISLSEWNAYQLQKLNNHQP